MNLYPKTTTVSSKIGIVKIAYLYLGYSLVLTITPNFCGNCLKCQPIKFGDFPWVYCWQKDK